MSVMMLYQALRAYATFLDEIMHDGDLAEEYFTRARRVEESVSLRGAWEAKTFAFGTRVDGVSHMDEHDAVLVITGAPRRLGEIVSANTKSAAMLCYQRVVLIGKYMHTLFPAPLSRWIQSELDTLAATGQCFIIENPMLMPVITSNGVLIPVVFHLKQHIPEAAGCPPQLMLVLKPVASDCEIVICDDSVCVCFHGWEADV
jgi:PAS domain-containing protein